MRSTSDGSSMEVDVTICEFTQIHCKIKCDGGIAFEIHEKFSFLVPGYKFMPSYKAGRWDGKIKLFDIRTRSFPIGLVPSLLAFLEENGYSTRVDGEFLKDDILDRELIDSTWNKSCFSPRYYQSAAYEYALKKRKCLILSPTGSGKSLIIYGLIRYLLEHQEGKILITVPTVQLVEQLHSDLASYQTDGWDPEHLVHRLYSGKDKNFDQRVVISTWHSVVNQKMDWFDQFNAYICDEAHGADSKSISSIIEKIPFAEYRIGMTGTLDGTVMHEIEMRARFGEVFSCVTSRELMDEGTLAEIDIEAIVLDYSEADRKLVKGMDYQAEIDFLVEHKQRNRLLCKIAANSTGNVLMLFNFIEKHGELLKPILEELCEKTGRKFFYIDGSTDVLVREAIRKKLEENDNCILLSTFGTMSTGINVKNLDVLLFCHPYKANIRILQSIGRVLRASTTKTKAKLIDFGDSLGYTTSRGTKKTNKVFEHFIHRLDLYTKQEFQYKVIKLKFL